MIRTYDTRPISTAQLVGMLSAQAERDRETRLAVLIAGNMRQGA